MKQFKISCLLVVSVAIIFILAACQSGGSNQSTPASGAVSSASAAQKSVDFRTVYRKADTAYTAYITKYSSPIGHKFENLLRVSQDGSSLTLRIFDEGRNYSSVLVSDIPFLLEYLHGELKFPDSLIENMSSASARDGKQSREFNGIRVTWSYDPTNGLVVIYEKAQ